MDVLSTETGASMRIVFKATDVKELGMLTEDGKPRTGKRTMTLELVPDKNAGGSTGADARGVGDDVEGGDEGCDGNAGRSGCDGFHDSDSGGGGARDVGEELGHGGAGDAGRTSAGICNREPDGRGEDKIKKEGKKRKRSTDDKGSR